MRRLGTLVFGLLIWSVLLDGCGTWKAVVPPPDEGSYPAPGADLPDPLRVQLRSGGDPLVVHGAVLDADTLRAVAPRTGVGNAGSRYRSPEADSLAIPMADISSLDRRGIAAGRTTVLVVALAAVTAFFVGIATMDMGMDFSGMEWGAGY